MTKKVIQMPKKIADSKFNINGEDIQLNFGLQFACEVDNYRDDVAVMQGIDNIVIVATSLIKRKLDVLIDLLTFSLKGVTDEPREVAEVIVEKQADVKGGLEQLFNLFFTSVLTNKFLAEQVQMNQTLIIHIMKLAEIEKQAREMQTVQITEQLEKDLNQAEEMKQMNNGDMGGE